VSLEHNLKNLEAEIDGKMWKIITYGKDFTDLVRLLSNILFFVEWERREGARYRTVLME
jgi:hypothetical protein